MKRDLRFTSIYTLNEDVQRSDEVPAPPIPCLLAKAGSWASFPSGEGPLAPDALPQGHQSPRQRDPVSSALPRYREALPHTLTHMRTHAHRHILYQARCPPQGQVSAVPAPLAKVWPTRDGPLPHFWPSRLGRGTWLRGSGSGRVGEASLLAYAPGDFKQREQSPGDFPPAARWSPG